MANLGITSGILDTKRTGNIKSVDRTSGVETDKPSPRAEVLAHLKEQAKAGAAADAALRKQWNAEPGDKEEEAAEYERLMRAINENRAATGERAIYSERDLATNGGL